MGTYKVPQNVESEDKILGPLSLKQFIYALVGLGWGLLTFAILKSVIVLWVFIGLPPALIGLGLGLYQREDQPLETFVIAVIQFVVRPKTRLWQKEPIAEVFHLEPPPPKPELAHRDPREVRSQLLQLADVIDTRGWAAKEPELQEPDVVAVVDLSDRIGADARNVGPTIVSAPEVTQADDMLGANAASENINALMENSVRSIREEAREKMRAPAAIAAGGAGTGAPNNPQAQSRTSGVATATGPAPNISSSTPAPSGAIVKLATEGGDLTVAQIAAQAKRASNVLAEGESVSLRNAS